MITGGSFKSETEAPVQVVMEELKNSYQTPDKLEDSETGGSIRQIDQFFEYVRKPTSAREIMTYGGEDKDKDKAKVKGLYRFDSKEIVKEAKIEENEEIEKAKKVLEKHF